MTTVFVTGASSGFGAEIARRSASTGASVYLAARREDRIAALAAELGATAVHLDVRDRAAVEKALEGLEIDVLVNNAGLALGLEPAPRARLDDWDRWSIPTARACSTLRGRCCPAWTRGAVGT